MVALGSSGCGPRHADTRFLQEGSDARTWQPQPTTEHPRARYSQAAGERSSSTARTNSTTRFGRHLQARGGQGGRTVLDRHERQGLHRISTETLTSVDSISGRFQWRWHPHSRWSTESCGATVFLNKGRFQEERVQVSSGSPQGCEFKPPPPPPASPKKNVRRPPAPRQNFFTTCFSFFVLLLFFGARALDHGAQLYHLPVRKTFLSGVVQEIQERAPSVAFHLFLGSGC